jgi:hypothetical protein
MKFRTWEGPNKEISILYVTKSISIKCCPGLRMWTIYCHDHAIAGITRPLGFFIGRLLVAFVRWGFIAQFNGQRTKCYDLYTPR